MIELISTEAEQAVIGALMLDNRCWQLVGQTLRPEHFADHENRMVIQEITRLADAGMPFDLVTVAQNLGPSVLMRLADASRNTPGTSNVEYYAYIVIDRYRRRQLASASIYAAGCAQTAETATDAVAQVRAKLDEIDADTEDGVQSPADQYEQWMGVFRERAERGGRLQGITTGFDRLDNRWFGLCGPDLIIIAGRPSMGKTTLGMNIAEGAARSGAQVLVFSMEMSAGQLYDRRVSALSGLPLSKIRECSLEGDEWTLMTDACHMLKQRRLYIDDRAGQSIDAVRLTAAAHKSRHGLDLAVVDYLGLMHKPGSENRLQEVRAISAGLKQMAKELNIPVIALAQLNRKSEERADKRPMMSDLRESGDIEQDADIVAFVHRESKYDKENPDWRGVAEIITEKHRNGECGTDYVVEELNLARFATMPYEFIPPDKRSGAKKRPGRESL